jgi:glycosyltransferase involved in cell wall biosynthesis
LVPLFLLAQLVAVVKLLRKHEYDVIHAHWIIPQGLIAVIAMAFSPYKPALVLTSHGGDLFALKGALLGRFKRWITGTATKLTVVSSAMKSMAIQTDLKSEQNIVVIPMGVDAHTSFVPPRHTQERKGLLFVGRLVDKKGLKYLLDAMPEILAKHPETMLTVIGDGPLRQTLEDRCQQLNIGTMVKFLGSRENTEIPTYLQQCAVAVFPSVVADDGDQEGAPVAIMEAQACACATIVADYPGVRDLIRDRENGLLVEQKSAEQIADRVNSLLSSPEFAREIGMRARNDILKHFDWEVISEQFESVFQSATGKRNADTTDDNQNENR